MRNTLPDTPTPPPSLDVRKRLAALRAEVEARVRRRPLLSEKSSTPESDRVRPARRVRTLLLRIAGILFLLIVPFLAFVRTAVWFYHDGHASWVALGGAGVVCGTLLTAAGARLSSLVTGRHRLKFIATRIVAPLVIVYCGYTLFYLSGLNAKTTEVQQYYSSVHPVLRIALGTVIFADREIVVTDAGRRPEDYARMGLPVYERSLHFEQESGWVHAVDLRTIGRAEWKNFLLNVYFRAMGFRTLRHVGTADHLHVSLPTR